MLVSVPVMLRVALATKAARAAGAAGVTISAVATVRPPSILYCQGRHSSTQCLCAGASHTNSNCAAAKWPRPPTYLLLARTLSTSQNVKVASVVTTLWPATPDVIETILKPITFSDIRFSWDSTTNKFGVSSSLDVSAVPVLK